MERWIVWCGRAVLEIVVLEIIVMGNPFLRLSDAHKKGLN